MQTVRENRTMLLLASDNEHLMTIFAGRDRGNSPWTDATHASES